MSVLLGNGNGIFQAAQTFAAGKNPRSVALADINGDGKADLVVANENGNTLSVLLGNGNGSFQTQQTFATGNIPVAVAVCDVNGDGILDLIAADLRDNTVSLLLGNGNGTFQAQQTFATGKYPASVAVSDLNGDGKLDLIVTNELNNTVSVLLGNGNGTFQTQQTFATGRFPLSVAMSDVNGDGRPDLVVANLNSRALSVLLNSANGDFTGQAFTLTNAAATHFQVSATPASMIAGTKATLIVTALDQFGQLSYAYTGTVHFSTTDGGFGVSLPLDYTFVPADNGVHVFTSAMTLVTLGTQTVTALDTTTGSITGNAVVTVTVPVADHFIVSAPAAEVAGVPISVTVTAESTFGNVATNYSGTVHFATSDPAGNPVMLPANYSFTAADAGLHVFTSGVKLITAGLQTITVTDSATSGISGSVPVTVTPASAKTFSLAAPASVVAYVPFNFTVAAKDTYGNTATGYTGIVDFTSSDSQALLPNNATLVNGVGTFTRPCLRHTNRLSRLPTAATPLLLGTL